jgi:hypothetical protein
MSFLRCCQEKCNGRPNVCSSVPNMVTDCWFAKKKRELDVLPVLQESRFRGMGPQCIRPETKFL